jgi:hypothetical protein
MKNLLLILLIACPCCAAYSQGTAFSYQGRLNSQGTPADGSYDLTFTLFSSTVTNTPITGPVTNSATAVSNGVFTVIIDFGNQFDGTERWLEIGVRTNGVGPFATLVPRQLITPTPYAIYATGASNASYAGTAGFASIASAIGSVAGTNLAQLNVPNTTVQATGTVTVVSGFIVGANLVSGGSGYGVPPAVSVSDLSGSNTVIVATVSNGAVATLTVQNAGNNYSANARLIIAQPPSNAIQTFSSVNIFNGINTFTDMANSFVGVFNGTFGGLSGGNLTVSSNINLPTTTTGSGIIFSGADTLIHAFGANNIFAGAGAGNFSLTGGGNVGIGRNALHGDTLGLNNTAIGFWALLNNTIGSYNTAHGNQALVANISGSNNTATGWGALNSNTGNNNTANGMQALRFNTTGTGNTASGFDALLENTTGSRNTSMGAVSLWNNITGNDNTALGYNALAANTNAVWNTAVGSGALQNNVGRGNTALGYVALSLNSTGTNNTALGLSSLQNNTSGNNNVATGPGSLFSNTTGSYNTGSGYETLHNNTIGLYNAALGYQAGYNLTTGSNNIDVGNLGVAGESSMIRIGTTGVHSNTIIAGVISGNGAGITNLNPASLAGFLSSNFWAIGGNSGTSPTNGNFVGTVDNQPFELRANNITGLRIESGSGTFNLIEGYVPANAALPGAFGATISGGGYAGSGNRAANFATVGGGYRNDAIGALSAIGGGNFNTADGVNSTVAGGFTNRSGGNFSVVAGGNQNNALGDNSVVAGGQNNSIQPGATNDFIGGGSGNVIQTNAYFSSIGGGFNNLIPANAAYSSISGGYINSAPGQYAFIGGGGLNIASGGFASIGGGNSNVAPGYAAAIGGGYGNQALGPSSTVSGGTNNLSLNVASTVSGGALNTNLAYGGVISGGSSNFIQTSASYAHIGGGANNLISTNVTFAVIGGGLMNSIQPNAYNSFIGSGEQNAILTNSQFSVVAGGRYNTIGFDGGLNFIGGGYGNYITPGNGFVFLGGGNNNRVGTNSPGAFVGGGQSNSVYDNSAFATIPGGAGNIATNFAFAAGSSARATNSGSFVWSDNSGLITGSSAPNSVTMRASGGFQFLTGTNSAGAQLAGGATSWSVLSDRNSKKNISAVEVQTVLEKLQSIPSCQWTYKWEPDSATPHIGPMAQDFKAAFYPGRDDKSISTLEFDGVEVAAIQGLARKLDEQSDRLMKLIQFQAEQIEILKGRLKQLENSESDFTNKRMDESLPAEEKE